MTEQEQKAFTAMREALEHIQRCIGFDKATIHQGSATWCEIEDALAAANAVSEQPQAEVEKPVYVMHPDSPMLSQMPDGTHVILQRRLPTATEPQAQVKLNPADLVFTVEVQHVGGFAPVNTSGVRVTHVPTGISVVSTRERSQHANRQIAIDCLKKALAATPEAP